MPALDRKAESINQAYSLISSAFEPTRRSHAGNVFQKVYVAQDQGLRSLDELRLKMEGTLPPEESSEL